MDKRYALIFLRDSQGRLLLQLRDGQAPKFPHQWAAFGGGVEAHESFQEGVAREAWEELRYRVRAPRLLGLFCREDYGIEVDSSVEGVRAYFVEDYDESQDLVLGEGADLGWFTPTEALGLDSPAHHLEVIRRLAEGEI